MAPRKPKYPIEELLRIRETTKDTSEAMRRISNSEIADHLLKNASSSSVVRDRRLRSSSIITNPYDESPPEDPHFRIEKTRSRFARGTKWSPSASLRRGKAEQLLKEHGSPPGIRVTAGGRIVPDTLSPLTSPRFDTFDRSGFAAQLGYFYDFEGLRNPASAPLDHGDAVYGQYFNGDFHAAHPHAQMSMMHVLPNMLPFSPMGTHAAPAHFSSTQAFPAMSNGLTATPLFHAGGVPTAREIGAMEVNHSKLELELKELNKNEVLQRSSLNQKKRDEIVKKRIELTQRLDDSRIGIATAKKTVDQTADAIAQQQSDGSSVFVQHSVRPSPMMPSLEPPALRPQPVSNGYHGYRVTQPCKFSGPLLHPDMPDFVPRMGNPAYPQRAPASPAALQERTVNVTRPVVTKDSSIETLKGYSDNAMGLDGSVVQQPRRSRAVVIKDPNEQSAREYTLLDPSCSSYDPDRAKSSVTQGDDPDSLVMASVPTGEVKEPDSSQKSHASALSARQSPHDSQQRSDSSSQSVNTADFFPSDPNEYSQSRIGGNRKQVSWMPKQGEPNVEAQKITTPSRPPNKFVFNDGSPADVCYSSIGSPTLSPSREEATPHNISTLASDDYRQGFVIGHQLLLLPEQTTEAFRTGYLAGVCSVRGAETDGIPPLECQPTGFKDTQPADSDSGDRRDVTMTESIDSPAQDMFSSPVVRMPEVPANSLATTPTRMRSERKATSSDSREAEPEFPPAKAAMSNAILSISSSTAADAGDVSGEPVDASDIKDSRLNQASSAGLSYVAARLKDRGNAMDQQRYSHSAISTVQTTNQHARGVIHSPKVSLTGSDVVMASLPIEPSRPVTPERNERTTKTASSPVKRKASAAVATMMQAAGLSNRSPGKIQQELSKASSPEKKQWRGKLSKSFRGSKLEGVKELGEDRKRSMEN